MSLHDFASRVVQAGCDLPSMGLDRPRKDPVAQKVETYKLSTIDEASLAALRAYSDGHGWSRPMGAVARVKDDAHLEPKKQTAGFVITKTFKGFSSWMHAYGYSSEYFISRQWFRLNQVWTQEQGKSCLCEEARLFHEFTLGTEPGKVIIR